MVQFSLSGIHSAAEHVAISFNTNIIWNEYYFYMYRLSLTFVTKKYQ